MNINEKVTTLRKILKEKELAAYIINGTDPHESEYVNERWKTRQWISGFTGSAGTVVITRKDAFIWVDSRYFVQCAEQIKNTCFTMKQIDGPDAVKPEDFLCENIKGAIGINEETLSVEKMRKYQKKGLNIVPTEELLDRIWKDRPSVPCNKIEFLSEDITGESSEKKIEKIRTAIKQKGAAYSLISSLDDIAWILNMRGRDIKDTPVFISHLLICPDKTVLFTPKERFSQDKQKQLSFEVFPYEAVTEHLSKLKDTSVYLNPEKINMKLYGSFDKSVKIIEGREISTDLKACKNEVEMQGMKKAHILDGTALVNFIASIKNRKKSAGSEVLSELSLTEKLEQERLKNKDYLGPSFSTIAGFAEHGAVVHYSATKETDMQLNKDGLLVLDSGGQYVYGTTDVTRTLLFGKPTKEQKRDYTLVLKGHLAIRMQIFPKGTTGHQLDVLAHQFLWNDKKTYYHGTGHGVGHRLSVHEGPQSLSSRINKVELQVSMVVSDEPGLYIEGKYGIRIENMIVVKREQTTEFGEFYGFENLTCCPYERDLIDKKMLTKQEIEAVDNYHSWVYKELENKVRKESLPYLKKATRPL